jgi:ssDNA thymidine ADP-ribosyltransferase, DarT
MFRPMGLTPVHAVVVTHGTRSLWHYTLAANLPGVLREGAVYSRAELQRRGIAVNSEHYYGDPEKERLLSEYVSCATMPPWGMMGDEIAELAILEIDPGVVTTPGTCFCPGWSPLASFAAAEIITWTDAEHVEALYSGEGYQTVRGAEIFVPTEIRIARVREIVFYDRAGADRALPGLRGALADAQETGGTSDQTITLRVQPTRFPRSWEAEGPPWMRDEDADDDPIF